jgi:hypothetical protein
MQKGFCGKSSGLPMNFTALENSTYRDHFAIKAQLSVLTRDM